MLCERDMEIVTRMFEGHTAGCRPAGRPRHGLPGKQGVSAEGRQAIALLKGREKIDRERLGRRGDRARRPGDRTGLPHPCLELFPGREGVSASNGPTRRGESARLRLWRTGWSVALKAGEPAYPGYNPGAGEGLRPFDPQLARAPVDCAGGGIAPGPPVAAQPDG